MFDNSMKLVMYERQSGWFSKSRGLSASVSFLSLPLPSLFSRGNYLPLNPTETLATQATVSVSFLALSYPLFLILALAPISRGQNTVPVSFLGLSLLPNLTEKLAMQATRAAVSSWGG